VELIAGLPDGEAAMDFENGCTARLADVNFHGWAVSHSALSIGSFGENAFSQRGSRFG
jgi:hypothetical protein